ncbi:MAG: hypothetical protein ACXVYM_01100 [Gaiellaceae bacterium]
MSATLVIDPRFNGPPASANGGYFSGLVAQRLAGPAQVTLHAPPPLGRPLVVESRGDRGLVVLDGGESIADVERLPELALELPDPIRPREAWEASERYPGFEQHVYPSCFVCGPERRFGDGLGIFAGPVRGRDLVASPWTPAGDLADEEGLVRPEFLWAAMDCPGAIAATWKGRDETLLGRLAARVLERPRAGRLLVVLGWPLGEERRKRYVGTALYDEAGMPVAFARATWIAPGDEPLATVG